MTPVATINGRDIDVLRLMAQPWDGQPDRAIYRSRIGKQIARLELVPHYRESPDADDDGIDVTLACLKRLEAAKCIATMGEAWRGFHGRLSEYETIYRITPAGRALVEATP